MALTKVSRGLLSTSIVDNGNATAITIDSSEQVGIGTSSPSEKLEIRNDVDASTDLDPTAIKLYNNSDGGSAIEFSNGVAAKSKISFGVTSTGAGTNDTYLGFSTGENAALIEAMRIDSSGNVGIGGTTTTGWANKQLVLDAGADTSAAFVMVNNTTGRTGSDGSVITLSGSDMYLIQRESANMIFRTANTERARIDASGNLLVGKTATNNGVAGVEASASGFNATVSGDTVSRLNRLSSDGQILRFQKDTTTVGSISSRGGEFIAVGSGDTFLEFNFGSDQINPSTGSASRDNAIDLGSSGARFDDIYATNGTIQTSDRNEKQDIEALSDAEQRVAVAAKGLLRKFRWINSVETKGDDARIHFGIIAQDLQAAFEAEGLDAGRYAMFTSNTWTDEETGEERTRLGVRYSELLAFIISAI